MPSANAPAARPPRWRSYLLLGRVSNLPTVWSNCLAGMMLAGAVPEGGTLAATVVALSLFYTGGMFLNDAFDHRFDAEFRPERPIPTGAVTVREVYAAGLGLLVLGEVALALPAWSRGEPLPLGPLTGGAVLAGLIVYYNWRHKTDPLSPLVMALCRAMVYLIAGAVAAGALPGALWGGVAVMICYLIGLTYVAKQENLQEVKNLWPVGFLAVPFLYGAPGALAGSWVTVLFLAFLAWVVWAISFLIRKEGRSIPRAVISLIAGISLLDALLIGQAGGHLGWGLAAVGAFAVTLLFQKVVPGT